MSDDHIHATGDDATTTGSRITPDPGRGPSAVAVLGLGQLGARLAQAFLAAGHATTVWNRTGAKADPFVAQGAVRADTVAEAVAAAPLVVVCLPDYPTVAALLDPLTEPLRGRILVNLTSGTPQDALDAADRAARHGIDYLDGAAMSGTRLVGSPEALFLFSGSPGTFAAARTVLEALGRPVHLGATPSLAAVYDTALFGQVWGALAGFHQALALTGTAGVDPVAFAEVATGYLGFIASMMTEHARHVRQGSFPDDDGTVEVHAAAMEHLLHTSRTAGIGTELPELLGALLARTAEAGHATSGTASISRTLTHTP
ncbi:NAD(P)-binding domain-containing protein [Streptomyces sp. NPDC097619]|uniref:NAD(P)-dependent oxidoreductase n=1 Tax=Streptomyces sp. NPDC097619 TaxID=3157228 RepID=UPI00332FA161